MDFKVDYVKLNEISIELNKHNEDLKLLFNDLLKIIDNLEDSWEGSDYEIFHKVSSTYIKSLVITTDELEHISSFMKEAVQRYSSNDETFSSRISNIGVDEKWNEI